MGGSELSIRINFFLISGCSLQALEATSFSILRLCPFEVGSYSSRVPLLLLWGPERTLHIEVSSHVVGVRLGEAQESGPLSGEEERMPALSSGKVIP